MNDIPYTIYGFNHCELYVGNAKQAAFYYQNFFGFDMNIWNYRTFDCNLVGFIKES